MRIVGMDIHRVAAEAVALLDGKLVKLGRIPMLRERLEEFAKANTRRSKIRAQVEHAFKLPFKAAIARDIFVQVIVKPGEKVGRLRVHRLHHQTQRVLQQMRSAVAGCAEHGGGAHAAPRADVVHRLSELC